MGRSSLLKAVLACLLLASGPAMADPVFDGTPPSPNFQLFPFWEKLVADMQTVSAPAISGLQPVSLTTAPEAAPPIACSDERHCMPAAWTDFVTTARSLDARLQLDAVNHWANEKPYVEDINNWGLPDYWETPGEFIAHGGDCEDFAIAKYFSLVQLGFSARDMRIVIVSDSKANDFHAVLVVEMNGTSWLLDNQLPAVVPLQSVPQYKPIYSLNQQGWWLHSQPVITVTASVVIAAGPMAPDAATPVRIAAN